MCLTALILSKVFVIVDIHVRACTIHRGVQFMWDSLWLAPVIYDVHVRVLKRALGVLQDFDPLI